MCAILWHELRDQTIAGKILGNCYGGYTGVAGNAAALCGAGKIVKCEYFIKNYLMTIKRKNPEMMKAW